MGVEETNNFECLSLYLFSLLSLTKSSCLFLTNLIYFRKENVVCSILTNQTQKEMEIFSEKYFFPHHNIP